MTSRESPQVAAVTKKAAKLKARSEEVRHRHGLLGKRDILAITGVSYPTIWSWMRAGTFPRARIVGEKSMWLQTEIEAWLADLKVRPLKGDVAKPTVERPKPRVKKLKQEFAAQSAPEAG
jgi:predicted DNA-binding transcriptional regulator AlpA